MNTKRRIEIVREANALRREVIEYIQRKYPDAQDARIYLHPKYAAEYLGYRYEEFPDLNMEIPSLNGSPARVVNQDTVGLIDRGSRRIQISERPPPEERRFTGAHEIAHARLHSEANVLHRDRQVRHGERRPPMEQEADLFAAVYLMPDRWVKKDVEDRFGTVPIRLDETLAFHLDPNDSENVLRDESNDLIAEFRMARHEWTDHNRLPSLAKIYHVTPYAMALRLKELGIIKRMGCTYAQVT